MKNSKNSSDPIFISVGHKISLESALEIVSNVCKDREPIPVSNFNYKKR